MVCSYMGCLCVSVFIYIHVNICSCASMCRPRGSFQMSFSIVPCLLLNPAFVDSATPGWLASSPSCLWLSRTGIIGVCRYTQIFMWVLESWFRSFCLHDVCIINWASLLVPLWLFWLRILHKWIISIPEDIRFVWMFNYL